MGVASVSSTTPLTLDCIKQAVKDFCNEQGLILKAFGCSKSKCYAKIMFKGKCIKKNLDIEINVANSEVKIILADAEYIEYLDSTGALITKIKDFELKAVKLKDKLDVYNDIKNALAEALKPILKDFKWEDQMLEFEENINKIAKNYRKEFGMRTVYGKGYKSLYDEIVAKIYIIDDCIKVVASSSDFKIKYIEVEIASYSDVKVVLDLFNRHVGYLASKSVKNTVVLNLTKVDRNRQFEILKKVVEVVEMLNLI